MDNNTFIIFFWFIFLCFALCSYISLIITRDKIDDLKKEVQELKAEIWRHEHE